MPNPTNASDSSSTTPTTQRDKAAEELYVQRGAGEASHRCDANTQFGAKDLADEILSHLKLAPGKSVVDVGCGTGQHLLKFREFVQPDGEAFGFDFNPDAVQNARNRGVKADVADGMTLPIPDESVDALSCTFAVYYLADLSKALTEWYRVMRPGGRVVVSGPAIGTNAELYEFHEKITGNPPSDVDQMALGYVENNVREGLPVAGFGEVKVEIFDNPITFPTHEAFIDYWKSTSLFIRSVPEEQREEAIQRGAAALAERGDLFVNTKKVAIAHATKT